MLVFLVIASMTLILLSQVLGRALSPMLNKYRSHVERELSTVLNSSVSIQNIDTRWDFMIPYLEISGVRIQPKNRPSGASEKTPYAQQVGNISVGINIIEMAKAKSFFPNSLKVKGLSVFVLKNKAGEFSLPGLNVPKRNESRQFEKYLNAIRHKLIQVSDAKLSVLNETTGTVLAITPIDFDFLSDKNRNRGVLTWVPKGGKKATIRFDLAGDVREPQAWIGEVNVLVPPLDMALLTPYLPDGLNIDSGHAGIQFDVKLDKMLVKESTGELDLLVNFDKAQTLKWKTPLSIINQSTRYNLRAQNPMTLGDTSIDVLKDAGVEIDFDDEFQFGVYGTGLDLATLPGLLRITSAVPESVSNHLEKANIQGEANRIFVGWNDILGWGASTRVSAFKIGSYANQPSVQSKEGVSVYADYFNETLLIDVDKQAFKFKYPKVFDETFDVKALSTKLAIAYDKNLSVELESFSLKMDEISLSGDALIDLPKGKPPYLRLNATGGEGQFSGIPKFVPKVAGKKTLSWFKQAFKKGELNNVRIDIDGAVNELIKNNSDATFAVTASAKNSTFSFLEKWPVLHSTDFDFELNNAAFTVTSTNAMTGDVHAKNVKATIADLNTLDLNVNIQTDSTPVNHLFEYAEQSQLLKSVLAPLLNGFEGSGQARLKLGLDVGISKKYSKIKKPRVNGMLDLAGANLYMPAMKMNASNLRGKLFFTQQSFDAKHISGLLNGSPLRMQSVTKDTAQGRRAYLSFDTTLSPSALLKDKISFITKRLSGEPNWHVILDFGLNKGAEPPRLNVMSNLKGLRIDLPEPLAKSEDVVKSFQWLMTLGDKSSSAYLNINSELEGAFLFDKQFILDKAQINYERGAAVLPKVSGLFIDVAADTLPIDSWFEYISGVSSDYKVSESNDAQKASLIQRVNVFGRKVTWNGYSIDHVISEVTPTEMGWQLDVASIPVSGRALLDVKNDAVSMHITFLDVNALSSSDDAKTTSHTVPGDLPNLKVSVDRLMFGTKKLQNISLSSHSEEGALVLDKFVLNDPHVSVSGSGKWFQDAQGQPMSEMTFRWPSNDLSKDLTFLGMGGILKQTTSLATGRLSWKGSPFTPDVVSLSGHVNVVAQNGIVESIKPGGVKLIGLFNAESLPKRLMLNFKDLSKKGLLFESIKSDISIRQGVATMDRFKMKADIGEIFLNGRIDLVHKRINQVAIVNPELSSVLPITGGAVGGIPGFFGGVLLERLIKIFGGNTDEVAQIRYSIKGPWNNPDVSPTDIKRIKDLTPEEMNERVKKIKQKSKQNKGDAIAQ